MLLPEYSCQAYTPQPCFRVWGTAIHKPQHKPHHARVICLKCCERAARDAMLCRFAKVAADGTYQPPPPANQKASYATLVYVRATIVEEAGWYLAKSLTIAVSESCLTPCSGPDAALCVHVKRSRLSDLDALHVARGLNRRPAWCGMYQQ